MWGRASWKHFCTLFYECINKYIIFVIFHKMKRKELQYFFLNDAMKYKLTQFSSLYFLNASGGFRPG